jgi:osmotically-inducible protein OsmY
VEDAGGEDAGGYLYRGEASRQLPRGEIAVAIRKTDEAIQEDVLDELAFDNEVKVTDVGVEVDDGVVTLTGTVETFAMRQAAERAAFRVEGVRAVANDVAVKVPGVGAPTDTELAKTIADKLERNIEVPENRIDVRVEDGSVILRGELDWSYERTAAEKSVSRVPGVVVVTNLIRLPQRVLAGEIRSGIERTLVRSAEIDAGNVNVDTDRGHVTLTGTVSSWVERDKAEEAAWRRDVGDQRHPHRTLLTGLLTAPKARLRIFLGIVPAVLPLDGLRSLV